MPTRDYTNAAKTLTVHWDSEKCVHCGNCIGGLPSVFDLGKRPWVNMEGASAEAITEQVAKCPSGALSLRVVG